MRVGGGCRGVFPLFGREKLLEGFPDRLELRLYLPLVGFEDVGERSPAGEFGEGFLFVVGGRAIFRLAGLQDANGFDVGGRLIAESAFAEAVFGS